MISFKKRIDKGVLGMLNKIFFIKDIDSHYVLYFLGVRLKIKHKVKFDYQEAKEIGINPQNRSPRIIVSLTSHPGRIKTTHITINTILQQTLKPDKIILWLTEEEFPQKEEELPQELLKLKNLGLTIDWCEAIKSYKKLIPSLRKYPDDIIITIDDDVYYPKNLLEGLYNSYLENPECISANRISRKQLINNKLTHISPRKYTYKKSQKICYTNMFNGAGGVLYPPHSLHKDALTPSNIIANDDHYFWAMAVLNKTKIKEALGYKFDLINVENTQQCAFSSKKRIKNNHELYDENVALKIYPEITEIIKQENKTEELCK